MVKAKYFGTPQGDVSRYTDKGIVEHYDPAAREFNPSTTRETVYDLDTSMKAITPEEAEVIMERSSKLAEKMNAG